MIINILLVAAGGATGSVLRYLCQRSLNISFPYGTAAVNLIGCFLVGLFAGLFLKNHEHQKSLLLITGFCGGFTTFSAFTLESIQMMANDRWISLAVYISLSVLGGLLATLLGYRLMN